MAPKTQMEQCTEVATDGHRSVVSKKYIKSHTDSILAKHGVIQLGPQIIISQQRISSEVECAKVAAKRSEPVSPRRRSSMSTHDKRWTDVFFRLALCLAMFSPAPFRAQTSKDILTSATSLIRAGQYPLAISELRQALRRSPFDVRMQTTLGIALSLNGDETQAIEALRAALRMKPDYLAALRAEAEILVRKQDPAAVLVLQQILRNDPGEGTAREMLALSQARAGDCKSAILNFAKVESAIDEHPESLLHYGACLYASEKYTEAATWFSRLVAIQPTNRSARYDLALVQVHEGEKSKASATLAPVLGPQADLDSLTLASEIAEELGDTPNAVAYMRQAIVSDPMQADSYVRFAELCMLHQSYDTGISMMSAGISHMPNNSALYLARGMLYGGKADYDRAEADFRSAELYDPKHGTGSYGVGLVQAQGHHADQALATVRAGLKEHPTDAQLHLLLGRLLIENGATAGTPEFNEAANAAAIAVKLNPDLVIARNLLAKVYSEQGQLPLAIEQWRAALKIDPTDETAMYRLMRASRQTGDVATSEELARKVAEMHQKARDEESNRLRFRIVEGQAPGAK